MRSLRPLVLVLVMLCVPAAPALAQPLSISVDAPQALLCNSVARQAIDDTLALLRRSFPEASISLNGRQATVRLLLPAVASSPDTRIPAPSVRPYLCTAVPNPAYRWRSIRQGKAIVLRLQAANPEGVAAGLYGLLQEKLGFRFHHPRESVIPAHRAWPLPARFRFSGTPRFEKRGFHLHTLHPIELTDQLHDPEIPGAFEEVRAYLDWLARNGQNTFQFFLLRGIDRTTWPGHARRIVEYAHSRGIRCGVEISLAMLQQQAFQAITLLRPYPSYLRQVDETLAWLFQAPWDYLSLEVTMGEHLPVLDSLLPELQMHIEREVAKRYGARLLYATHVIRSGNEDAVRGPRLRDSGIMIHTVMCYSASEARAPVYGNDNQRFMLEASERENRRRETWFWPESSYWVGFDSSVPLLLLPYLQARWDDIGTMSRIGLSGHLTFSSGWEWGYWLVDWSIARWSWRFDDNGRKRDDVPLSRLNELLPDPKLMRLWQAALELQNRYLKERELLRYLSALTPFSELPFPFNKPFQPEPPFRYAQLLDNKNPEEEAMVVRGTIRDLESYADRMATVTERLESQLRSLQAQGALELERANLAGELLRGLQITGLRARHRALTLRALLAKRKEHAGQLPHALLSEPLLDRAVLVRAQALSLVRNQERIYRYPLERIGRKHANLTAYHFGYLYPVSNLFFWEREEQQVRRERFDAFFMNLWDVRRTLGLESLLFR
ncbi:hypothetical protein [Geobacter sp. SVR]|uniref:hypothetical protein n=1 Tax=Geobacter sp. SVR TaxID=2495594 RepID=UPI00143F0184|nr:hypothetical protein [Geobacter sp. SVR]BCS53377.1 hypothetical protein GSVR_16850 [Geobacter sp. SVR]GCF85497.1 hypothetical protein GSbR_20970 [Geobacter sp. SVR]